MTSIAFGGVDYQNNRWDALLGLPGSILLKSKTRSVKKPPDGFEWVLLIRFDSDRKFRMGTVSVSCKSLAEVA